MKKDRIVLLGLSLLALSCAGEKGFFPDGEVLTFTADWVSPEETRTVLKSDGTTVWWEPEDEINVFFGNEASGLFTATNTQSQAVTDFRGTLSIVVGSIETDIAPHAYWAVYPYNADNTCDGESVTLTVPSSQASRAGSFAAKSFPAIATSTNFHLPFYNICGGARFSVAHEGIRSVTFRTIGEEPVAGEVRVGFGAEGTPVVKRVLNGCPEVTVQAPEGGFVPGEQYFVSLLPQSLSQGISLTFKRSDGKEAVCSLEKPLTVHRSVFGILEEKDKGLEFYGEDVTVDVSSVKLDRTTVYLREGESTTLSATIFPEDASNKAVNWTSSNTSVAIVDTHGKVNAIMEGNAVITATAGNETATCSVSVYPMGFHPNGEYLSFTGETPDASISYTIRNSKYTFKDVEYSYDTEDWYPWPQGFQISLFNGAKVYVRGRGLIPSTGYSYTNPFRFLMTGKIAAGGNVMSLLYYDDFEFRTSLDRGAFSGVFENCSGLTTAPDLPATALADFCYFGMFYGCTGLTSAPALPATSLASYCYEEMFSGCTGLTSAPALPATSLASYCYKGMFWMCSGLTSAPALPATSLTDSCYSWMFKGCTGLTSAPALPAITLARSCYEQMFYDCTGLTSAPALPATSLADGCYSGMFKGCTGLTSAPALPATSLADLCYSGMFSGCTGLTSAPALSATTLASNCYSGMFGGCTSLTTAPELPATTLASRCYSSMFFNCTGLTSAPALPAITLASSCYETMFYDCTGLTSAPALPATTLASGCYAGMFLGCTSLTTAPELPATSLADQCYSGMFSGCTGLTTAPDLPATTLASSCYNRMFYDCVSLTRAPDLPATALADQCYYAMFYDCNNLTHAPDLLPAPRLADNCYTEMFYGCVSLTRAPDLPAETLAGPYYIDMFNGCRNLAYVKMMAKNIPNNSCFSGWLNGVSAEGVFVKNSAATWNEQDIIPYGWTVISSSE